MFKVVVEISGDDAEALLTNYNTLCIVFRFIPQKVSYGKMCTFFLYQYWYILTRIFYTVIHFYFPLTATNTSSTDWLRLINPSAIVSGGCKIVIECTRDIIGRFSWILIMSMLLSYLALYTVQDQLSYFPLYKFEDKLHYFTDEAYDLNFYLNLLCFKCLCIVSKLPPVKCYWCVMFKVATSPAEATDIRPEQKVNTTQFFSFNVRRKLFSKIFV